MISILVANWNSGDRLPLLARSLASATDVELLVCDNDSHDGSAEGLDPERPATRLFRQSRNLGFGGAMNFLASHARGDVLLLLNPDCTLPPETLPALRAFHAARPQAGLVGLRMVDRAGATQDRYLPREIPTLGSLARQTLLPGLGDPRPQGDRSGPASQLAGTGLSMRADTFHRLGGFDEQFWPAWFEDVDLARRARAAGIGVEFLAEATIVHEGGYSAEVLGYSRMLPIFYGNLLRYGRKHHGVAGAALLRATLAVGMLGRAIVALVGPRVVGHPRAEALAAYRSVFGLALGRAERRHHHRDLEQRTHPAGDAGGDRDAGTTPR